jgi:hypothetical protein
MIQDFIRRFWKEVKTWRPRSTWEDNIKIKDENYENADFMHLTFVPFIDRHLYCHVYE